MKRKIAIMLTALSVVLCLSGCERNVSETKSGRVTDSANTAEANGPTGNHTERTLPKDDRTTGRTIIDDMEHAASDAGRAIEDAVTGSPAPDTGMNTER